MKNIMQYLMTGFIGLSMFFCLSPFLPAADKPKDKDGDAIKLTLADDGKTIKAATGKKIEISLKGNPTTGFEWRMVDLKSEVVKADGKGEYIPDKYDSAPGRFGRNIRFQIHCRKTRKGNPQIRVPPPLGKRQSPRPKIQREPRSGGEMKNRLSFVNDVRCFPFFPLSLFSSLNIRSMPELPEVETMCRRIAAVVGCRISDLKRPNSPLQSILINPRLSQFCSRVKGQKIVAVDRIGKRVVLSWKTTIRL